MSKRNMAVGAWVLLDRLVNGDARQPWPVPSIEREYVASLRQHGYVRRAWQDTQQDLYVATATGRRALRNWLATQQENGEARI